MSAQRVMEEKQLGETQTGRWGGWDTLYAGKRSSILAAFEFHEYLC